MKVVMDASPAMFLAKIRRLAWVQALFGDDIQVTSSVREESISTGMDSGEEEELNIFFSRCSVKAVQSIRRFSSALSGPDNDALTLAVECGADIMICDDRILRLMAQTEGIRPIGTLGILLRATHEGSTKRGQTVNVHQAGLHQAGSDCKYSISIPGYRCG